MVELAIAHEERYMIIAPQPACYTHISWSESVIKWQWRIDTKIDQRIHDFPFSAMHCRILCLCLCMDGSMSLHVWFRVLSLLVLNVDILILKPVVTHHACTAWVWTNCEIIILINVVCIFKSSFGVNPVCVIVLMICALYHADCNDFLLFCIDYDIEAVHLCFKGFDPSFLM